MPRYTNPELPEEVNNSDRRPLAGFLVLADVVARTRPALLAAARRIGTVHDADDAVQAAYLCLVRRAAVPPEHPLAWLVAAVVRIAYRNRALARRDERLATLLARPAEDDPRRGAVRCVWESPD